ncbi:MAG: hypothetical protein WCA46_17450 [Actinocatenispora sp.]
MTAEPVRSYPDVERPARTAPPDRTGRGRRSGVLAPERETSARSAAATAAIPKPRTRVPQAAERRATRTAPPVPVAAPRAPFVALVVGLVVAGIVGLLVLNTAINSSSLSLQHLRDKQEALDAQEQQLNQELADRESPGSLRAAATRLGLVPAGTTAFIRLPDGKVIGVPQPARGTGSRAG